MRELIIVLFSLLYCITAAPAPNHPDKVISLPGAPLSPAFNLFSGYLNSSWSGKSAPIFYVLAESIRVDPSTAPLLVWFNGGPGGTSLAAFFKEHGPYRITERGELTYNEFSWNQYANVIYLESPLGVGFSQNSDRDITLNDMDAAEINFNALKDFMTKVHPNYADRDYYLTGQSYAGAYVPYLARRLLEGIDSEEMVNKRFKGFAIGSPVFNYFLMALTNLMQFHSYGLIPQTFTETLFKHWAAYERGEELSTDEVKALEKVIISEIFPKVPENSPVNYNFVEHCYNRTYSQETYHLSTEKDSIACYGNNALVSFMNRNDVQTALHVGNPAGGTITWESFNLYMGDHYYRDYNVLHVYDDIFRLVNGSSFRVLIYEGDTDVMVPPVHTIESARKVAERNSMEIDQKYTAWRFYGDFAGIRNEYRNGRVTMDVITVRGAGHNVPTDLPAQAFQMINNFVFTKENEAIDYSEPIKIRDH